MNQSNGQRSDDRILAVGGQPWGGGGGAPPMQNGTKAEQQQHGGYWLSILAVNVKVQGLNGVYAVKQDLHPN